MAKINFTAARVDAHHCPPGEVTEKGNPVTQAFLWDSKTPGLGLRATIAGAKSYIFQGKIHGQTVRLTIGDTRSWTISKAQEEARRLQTLIDSGQDPREVKEEQRASYEARQVAALRESATVSQAWADYMSDLRTKISPKTKQPRSATYINDHIKLAAPGGTPTKRGSKQTERGPLYPLMGLKLSELTTKAICTWLESEVPSRPTSAAYAFRMLKAFARWCEGHDTYAGIVAADWCTSPKVTGLLPRNNTKDGDSLQREQLAAWFAAVHGLPNPVQSAYLQGLLITGARREELAALRWEDVDFQWRSLHIADKIETEAGRVIPLTPYLASLLLNLKRVNETPPSTRRLRTLEARGEKWEPSPWVFSSLNAEEGHIAEPRYAHNQATEAAGLPHITLHGLRRSFGTLSEWIEVPVGVVAQIQGHKPSALAEKHYRRRPLDMLRMWHDKIEAWMLEQAGVEFQPTACPTKESSRNHS
ncbi:tyrosine-type recombinase/integrase [Ralstonia sp. A12]|uniref:tyrosine-type recombinase/integrase n=1 Tax=Ralstonia sp. A12 TaxID=1217052 RepID=UPI000693C7F0|nr:integrase family protein [Ralstonia sp. A12]